MISRLYIPIYALTLLLSAALLFSIQPMFSKLILPLLGGSAQVWNTAMLFFQLCLLAGYAYAHTSSHFLKPGVQAGLHIFLLLIFTVVLPFGLPEGWSQPTTQDPTIWQLSLMTITVGGPFFVLSGSAPMIQRWFSHSSHKDAENPYFLYGSSNLGSMSALLLYPFLIEPLMPLNTQFASWMYGYFALIILTILCLSLFSYDQSKHRSSFQAQPKPHNSVTKISWSLRLQWLLFAFIPSSLMLGVTTFITTDIASAPLLWILPLSIYVGTFILVFARKPLFKDRHILNGFTAFIIILIFQMIFEPTGAAAPFMLIALHLLTFFFAAMLCHNALAKLRPAASHLTEFYLIMSIGGALGGFFNAIIAPQLLTLPIEYGLILAIALFARYFDSPRFGLKQNMSYLRTQIRTHGLDFLFTPKNLLFFVTIVAAIFAFALNNKVVFLSSGALIVISLALLHRTRWRFALCVIFILSLFPLGFRWGHNYFSDVIYQTRNFFGVLRVIDTSLGERVLLHGTTNHGLQALDERYKLIPLAYYSYRSPLGDAFRYLDSMEGPQRIANIGLGVGVVSCYPKEGRHFDFFEIDKDIADIAQNPQYFSYLSDCGSPYDIVLGDGRLTIQEQSDRSYDMLLVDAFSSDNIPIHLLTIEAIEIYLSKVKDTGGVILHISNNYVDIEPVLTKAAEKTGYYGLARVSDSGFLPDTTLNYFPAHYFVLTRSEDLKAYLELHGWSKGQTREGVKLWSDQYSNLVSVLGNRSGNSRSRNLPKK